MPLSDNSRVGHLPLDVRDTSAQTHHGWTDAGLRSRPIGRWTFQVTGGNDGADTFDFTVGGTSILLAPVAWTTSHNTTATAIATAINANSAASGFYATVSTDTVTIRQRRSGAKTIVKVVVGDAAGTLTAAFASSDTWTEVQCGAAFDGDEYYELSWSGALVVDTPGGVNLTGAVAESLDLYGSDQAFQLWSGKGVQTSSNVILSGYSVAADTWERSLPWLGALPLTVKFAADVAVIKYRVRYF